MTTLREGNYNCEGIVSELPGYMSRKDVLLTAGVLYQPMTVLGLNTNFTAGATAGASNTGNGTMGTVTITPTTAANGRHTLTITGTGATAAFNVAKPDGTLLTAGAVGSAYSQGGLGFTLADGAVDFIPGDVFYIDVPVTIAPIGTVLGNGAITAATAGAGVKPGVYRLTFTSTGATAAFEVEDPDGIFVDTGAVGTAFASGGLGFTIADGATDYTAGEQLAITVGGLGTAGALTLASTTGLATAAVILRERIDTTDGALTGNVLYRDADVVADALVWPTGFTASQKATAIAQLRQQGLRAVTIPPTVGV